MEFFNLDNLKILEKKLEDSNERKNIAAEYGKMINLSEELGEALVFTDLFEMDLEKFEILEAQINDAYNIMSIIEFAHFEVSKERLNRRKYAEQERRIEKLKALKKALNSFLDEFLE